MTAYQPCRICKKPVRHVDDRAGSAVHVVSGRRECGVVVRGRRGLAVPDFAADPVEVD